METLFEVVGNVAFSMVRTQQCAQHIAPMDILTSAVGIGKKGLLKVIAIFDSKVYERWI